MVNRLILWIGLIMICNSLFSKEVPLNDARRAGLNFYYERINQYHPTDYDSLRIQSAFIHSEGDILVYYIFTFPEKGFVIVSADDLVIPVLAYSFDGTYEENNLPPQYYAWMQQYSRQIRYAVENQIPPLETTIDSWEHLLTANPGTLKKFRNERAVEPFILSKWNQDAWYNEMCPADSKGPGGHAYAGCVPTAMGQIMYYYRWPDHGTASYSYTDSTYGLLHANFDSTWYKWDNMKNSIISTNPGIAELLYHLGVSCDLVYGASGSGMYNHKAAYSLRTFFKYAPQTQYVFRDSTNLDWDSLIMAHLDRKMPLYYAGWSVPNLYGHAFVCDGYQDTNYFHFNFGWSGSADGYYYLENLTPGGNNFNLAQELIINIYPDTLHYTYPGYCNGIKTLKYKNGSVTDGSGPLHDYLPGTTCEWLIDPQTEEDSITSITFTFDKLQTNPADLVEIYNGDTNNAILLGQYSGNAVPPSITSPGNKMLIRFVSNSGQTAPGWIATYTTKSPVFCTGLMTITADTAVVTDGSMGFNYNNNSSCRWKIDPANQNGQPLTIYFKSFDTEIKDALMIFDFDNLDPEHPLAEYAGHYESSNLPPPVTSPSGKMLLLFYTSKAGNGKGWEFYYPKSHLGIIDKGEIQGLAIYPNPAHEEITVRLFNEEKSYLRMELITVTGESIFTETGFARTGWHSKKFNLSGCSKGIYFLKIQTINSISTRKIVIN